MIRLQTRENNVLYLPAIDPIDGNTIQGLCAHGVSLFTICAVCKDLEDAEHGRRIESIRAE